MKDMKGSEVRRACSLQFYYVCMRFPADHQINDVSHVAHALSHFPNFKLLLMLWFSMRLPQRVEWHAMEFR